jgi:hypothetical protein
MTPPFNKITCASRSSAAAAEAGFERVVPDREKAPSLQHESTILTM